VPNLGVTIPHLPFDFVINGNRKPKLFKFEKWWFELPEFKELVYRIWETPYFLEDPIEIWQFKIRLLRKKLKGWD
jgi:hypothetical protein